MKNTRNVKTKHFRGTPGRFKNSPIETYTKAERQEAAEELRALWQAEIQRAEELRNAPMKATATETELKVLSSFLLSFTAIMLGIALAIAIVYGVAYGIAFLGGVL